MNKIAVFPGSFDPITKGHENIINRALPLFDKIIVAIGENADKKSYFKLSERIKWIETVFSESDKVIVETYSGLTVDFCEKINANYILRGLRTSADFEFERSIGQTNKKLLPSIETVFLLTIPEFTPINSSIVRDVHQHGGNVFQFIPDSIHKFF